MKKLKEALGIKTPEETLKDLLDNLKDTIDENLDNKLKEAELLLAEKPEVLSELLKLKESLNSVGIDKDLIDKLENAFKQE